jgi:hypothetical protein
MCNRRSPKKAALKDIAASVKTGFFSQNYIKIEKRITALCKVPELKISL